MALAGNINNNNMISLRDNDLLLLVVVVVVVVVVVTVRKKQFLLCQQSVTTAVNILITLSMCMLQVYHAGVGGVKVQRNSLGAGVATSSLSSLSASILPCSAAMRKSAASF